jgi:hypothetical protein
MESMGDGAGVGGGIARDRAHDRLGVALLLLGAAIMALYLLSGNPKRDELKELHDLLVESVGDRFTLHNCFNTVMLFVPDGRSAVHAYYPNWPSVSEMHEEMVAAWFEHLLTGEEARAGDAK